MLMGLRANIDFMWKCSILADVMKIQYENQHFSYSLETAPWAVVVI